MWTHSYTRVHVRKRMCVSPKHQVVLKKQISKNLVINFTKDNFPNVSIFSLVNFNMKVTVITMIYKRLTKSLSV